MLNLGKYNAYDSLQIWVQFIENFMKILGNLKNLCITYEKFTEAYYVT